MAENRSGAAPPVVAIGASAGGLEALERFFSALPSETGAAYVVIQHLSRHYESHMDQLLGRRTSMPVRVAQGDEPVQPNHVYLIPTDAEIRIEDGRLQLSSRPDEGAPAHPIDLFFESLAQDQAEAATVVVLSGTGSDGTRGLEAVSDAGGLVLCQSEGTAGFGGMLLSAQATGKVHLIAGPSALATTLASYLDGSITLEDLRLRTGPPGEPSLKAVLRVLQSTKDIDFSVYKPSTLTRRIQRRMDLTEATGVDQYLELLQSSDGEQQALVNDLLIGVTSFFRDPESWAQVSAALDPLIEAASQAGQTLRAWVAGCASGEEAYSLAMLADDRFRALGIAPDYKIFATDVDSSSLRLASRGQYGAAALTNLPPGFKERYFDVLESGDWVVQGTLRERIVFAQHNVASDAPFTQLDFVSCRNLLIYLQPQTQNHCLAVFHYALKPQGLLFLGSSETTGEHRDEFEIVHSSAKLHRKRRDVRLAHTHSLTHRLEPQMDDRPLLERHQGTRITESQLFKLYDQLLESIVPESMLLDAAGALMHSFSGAERFLKPRGGRHSNRLQELINPSLRTPLVGALQQARRKGQTVRYNGLQQPGADTADEVTVPLLNLAVRPLTEPAGDLRGFLVTFEPAGIGRLDAEAEITQDRDSIDLDRIRALEGDLQDTRDNLSATIEALESSNEELQATNEEMLASNEELQSTNEELQSVNEELYTVNHEHQLKIEELARANEDMDNLLALTQVGVLFLDEDLNIRRYTPEVGRILKLMAQDVGRPVASFLGTLNHQELSQDLERVQRDQVPLEIATTDVAGTPYLVKISPFQSSEDDGGVIMTLIDTGELRFAEAELHKFRYMSEQTTDGQMLIDQRGRLRYGNPAIREMTGHRQGNWLNLNVARLDPELDRPNISELFERLQRKERVLYETEIHCADGSGFSAELNANLIDLEGEKLIFATVRDTTARQQAEASLALYRSAIEAAQQGICIADAQAEHATIIYCNDGFLTLSGYERHEIIGQNIRFLQGPGTDPSSLALINKALSQGEQISLTLINYRKDGTPFWNSLNISPVRNRRGRLTHFVSLQKDVSQAYADRDAPDQTAAQLLTLLNTAAEGIYGLDADGSCTFCNDTGLRLLGYTREDELIGRDMQVLIHQCEEQNPAAAPKDNPMLRSLREGATVSVQDAVFETSRGDALAVDYNCRPILVDGNVAGAVVSFTAAAPRLEQENQLRQALADADSANRAKSRFLASVSHEIRTPLSAIVSHSDLLLSVESEAEDQQAQERASAIKRNAISLLDLINDILDLSKIEADQLELLVQPVALASLLDDVVAIMQVRAEQKALSLRVQVLNPFPEIIQCDRVRLRQVLVNLVSNAVKFTESGFVRICVGYEAQELVLRVDDTGIGIEAEKIERLFEPFHQGGRDINLRYGGTGLGLSISRRLVEDMGGRIRVESVPNLGSSFEVRIPAGDVESVQFLKEFKTTASEDAPVSKPALAQLSGTILLAEDNPDVLETTAELLKHSGADVRTAFDGQDALELFERKPEQFDLLLLDIEMPRLDGLSLIETLRSQGYETPAVALTAQAMQSDVDRAHDAGFDEFLAKPVEAELLINTLKRLLRDESVNPSGPTVLVVDDHADSVSALAQLLQLERCEVYTARSGHETQTQLRQIAPDLCLLDVNLPDINGDVLVQELKAHEALQNTVFIATTGEVGARAEERLKDAGFDDFLPKPVDFGRLKHVIENWKTIRDQL